MSALKKLESTTQDEIEQIMSEIEQLQQEIGTAEAQNAAITKKTTASTATAVETDSTPAGAVQTVVEEEEEEDYLSEFRDSQAESSLEDTLAQLKQDLATPTARSLLDDEPVAETEDEATDVAEESEAAEEPEEEEIVYAGEESAPTAQTIETKEQAMANEQDNAGTLSMTLKGNMTLKLNYEMDGQTVTVSFADNALHVQLLDGTEFKIPVRPMNRATRTRAA